MRTLRAKLHHLREEAGEGTNVGLVYTLAVALVGATLGAFAVRGPGDAFPWQLYVPILLVALVTHLTARWRRHHGAVDIADKT